jgi:plasmid stabilization system protein ParE
MDIIWLPLAESALEDIYFFYAEHNIVAAKRIIANIKKEVGNV